MSLGDEEQKKVANKKERLSQAIRNNLNQSEEDTFTSAGYHSAQNSSQEKNSEKKELSQQNTIAKSHSMESSGKELRKIDPKTLQAAEFEYHNNRRRKKSLLIGLAVLLGFLFLVWFWNTASASPKLYLSDMPIDRQQLASLPLSNLTFEPYRQIHLYFDAAGTIGVEKLYIQVSKVLRDSEGKIAGEEAFWSDEVPVKSHWEFFSTLFQEDFFIPAQEYKISILSPTRKVLAEQYLTIK